MESAHGKNHSRCFFLVPAHGPGPGAYEPHTDMLPSASSTPPAHYLCQICRRRGHWKFECPDKEMEAWEEEEEFASERGARVREFQGQHQAAQPLVFVCKYALRPDERKALGLGGERAAGSSAWVTAGCWGIAKWETAQSLAIKAGGIRPATTRVCKHCASASHYTYDCHRMGLLGDALHPQSGRRVGVCPACRIANAVAKYKPPPPTEPGGPPSPRSHGPCGRHPGFLCCPICHSPSHFRCECPHKPKAKQGGASMFASVKGFDGMMAALAGGTKGSAGKDAGARTTPGADAEAILTTPPANMVCRKCGSLKHWAWCCPKDEAQSAAQEQAKHGARAAGTGAWRREEEIMMVRKEHGEELAGHDPGADADVEAVALEEAGGASVRQKRTASAGARLRVAAPRQAGASGGNLKSTQFERELERRAAGGSGQSARGQRTRSAGAQTRGTGTGPGRDEGSFWQRMHAGKFK